MRLASGAWVPLVEGEIAKQAIAAAEAIARDLSANYSECKLGMGLSGGEAGLALFFEYLARSLGDTSAGERAEHHLARAIAELEEQGVATPNLYHGFAGVAWVAEHLAAEEIASEDEDPNAEIDAALLSILRRGPWRGECGLLEGLVGWGVYALERMPRPFAEAMLPLLVARLAESGERGAHGITWRDRRNPAREPDMGMAHGAAGAIALLARMLEEGVAPPGVASLLAAAVDSVLARAAYGQEDIESDLAWCAGNAGISAALVAGGRACGRDDWKRLAASLAAAAADRYSDENGVLDPALCHGTAGLSHLFHRLYQAIGDPVLLGAARRWLARTLAHRRIGEGVGGYLCRGRQSDGSFGWVSSPGFLTGAAGIGLALLAAASPIEPAWDRLLMISGRARNRVTY